jgi:hypothetical protein
VDYGKFGSTGVKKFTVSNDGSPIPVPGISPPSPTVSQNNTGSMISNTSQNSPIILHTEKQEYVMGEDIKLRGIIKFVDGKAVGIGLPKNLDVSIEVYDSKNSFIDVHVLNAKNDDTFILNLETGTNSKISKDGQYYFVAYYGMITQELLSSDYVGRHNVYVGASALPSPVSNVNDNTIPNTVNTPITTPTNTSAEPFVVNWLMIVILVITAIAVIIIVQKLGLFSNSTREIISHTPSEKPSMLGAIGNPSVETKVIQEIKNFTPPREKLKHEYNYQLSLHGWLNRTFPSAVIEETKGASRPDIVINDVAIEIKGPTKTADLTTIADKLLRYKLHYKKLIIVLFEIQVSEKKLKEWETGLMRMTEIRESVTIIKK